MSTILNVELKSTTIIAPLSVAVQTGHRARHVEVQLTREQADALRLLRRGLAVSGARLIAGREVSTAPQAIQWLLEQLAAGPQAIEGGDR